MLEIPLSCITIKFVLLVFITTSILYVNYMHYISIYPFIHMYIYIYVYIYTHIYKDR